MKTHKWTGCVIIGLCVVLMSNMVQTTLFIATLDTMTIFVIMKM